MTTATARDLDLSAITRTGEQLGLDLQTLAGIVGVDQSTLYRWRHGASAPRGVYQTRLIQCAELFEILRRLFKGPDLASEWLHTAAPASLGGRDTPLAVLRSGRIDRVLLVLHTLAAGG